MKNTMKVLMMAGLIMTLAAAAVSATESTYGATSATNAIASGSSFTVTDMLRWAAEDEYLARGEYEAIMKRFGTQRPYSNIMSAEEQHLSWLKAEYKTRNLPFPTDGSASHIIVPVDLKAAAQAGVDAEIGNIGMYKTFLARPELAKPENASAKALFEQLMRASENHLKAFKNQLNKF